MELKNIIDNIDDYKAIDNAMDFVIKNNIRVYSQTLLDLIRINFNVSNDVRYDYESTIISTIITNDILCKYNITELFRNKRIAAEQYSYKNLDYISREDFLAIKKDTYIRMKGLRSTFIEDAFILASFMRRNNLYSYSGEIRQKLLSILDNHQIKSIKKMYRAEQKEMVYQYTKILLTKTVMEVYIWKAFYPVKFEGIYYLHNRLKTLDLIKDLTSFFNYKDSYIYLDYAKKFDSFLGNYKGLLKINNYIKKES